MGDQVDNWYIGEHFQKVNGLPALQGWGVSKGRGIPGAHESSPDVPRATLDTLIGAAQTSETAFATEAATAWGAWWQGKPSAVQTYLWRLFEATAL